MHEILNVNYNNSWCYDIIFHNSYDKLGAELEKLELSNRKVCIVCDSNTSIYLQDVIENTKNHVAFVDSYVFPAGEENKTLDTVKNLYEHLIKAHFDRNDVLFALGGGVVGDLVGYTAATYLRGIRFVQLPTTLLSMVDSSVGGKTGVDFDAYKNMVGAFHQPKCVYMNLATLQTLPAEQFSSGMAEVIKYGYIKEAPFYQWLQDNHDRIMNQEYEIILEMVYRSCLCKKEVVERDPHEKGERALLNLGHTLGHAVEKLMNFKLFHGQCVAIGTVAAIHMSVMRGMLSMEELEEAISVIRSFGLPVGITGLDITEIIAATKNDKKMEAGKIKFILLEKIGNAIIDSTVTDDEMRAALEFIQNK
ncbi:3-dehydroquinate synthase [Anaerosporobacter sp.]|uniref:3-dehydroquinate synthase n=1 Tax=Anaerosporobacter sp. TaxID=1872529 RepID=UPI00286F0705|nr:3-dehydroquinate synthase [Anaerosporobacter sp.]